ncbi:two-component system response regulator FixJ [Bradyrhizobium sp. OAE829]
MAEYVPDRFACLMTDVSMPGHSGLDLLQHLRSLGSAMPVIIVTADTNPATRSRAMRGGAYAYLTKPVSSDVLFRHLQSALRHVGSSPDGDGQRLSDG